MRNNKSILWTLLWLGLAVALLTGCGGKSAEFKQSRRREHYWGSLSLTYQF